ncbi:hypothetical protein EBR37_04310, partial [bacterium]|nr:hypothetical protein [bacterium]
MSKLIDELLSKGDTLEAIKECVNSKQYFLALFILKLKITDIHSQEYKTYTKIILEHTGNTVEQELNEKPNETSSVITIPDTKLKTVKLLCNWCSSQELANLWNKMSKGNYTWGNIRVVWKGEPDYYVIVNSPREGEIFSKKRSIVFRMEPNMSLHPEIWKEWANPDSKDFLRVLRHENGDYNNNEWHLSGTYETLSKEENINKTLVLSTILSEKYRDPGHIKRIDFVKFIENSIPIDVYGDNSHYYIKYCGPLPYHHKDQGLYPYKYTFNAENHSIKDYYTEKLTDGILAECLVFYYGCPNVKDYIDERAYVQLDLTNFQKDLETIQTAIQEDWHTQRLPYIREAKQKILNELGFWSPSQLS